MIRRFTFVSRDNIYEMPMILGKKRLKPTNITYTFPTPLSKVINF